MNKCNACKFWRRVSTKTGSCAMVFLTQGNRAGYLVTRWNHGCQMHETKDELVAPKRQTHIGEVRYGR